MCALNFTIAFAFEVKHTGRNNNIREIIVATSDLAPCALGNYLRVVPPRPVRTLYGGVEEVVHSLALLQNKSRSPASHSFPVIGIQALGCRGEHAAGFPIGLPQMWNWRRQLVHTRIILAQQQTKVFGSLHMLSVHEKDPTTKVGWSMCCRSLRSLCCLCTACLCIACLSPV